MLNFINIKYSEISTCQLNDLFFLRKKSFKDRLNWLVKCKNNKEFDEYDNKDANYILGLYKNRIICGVRLIDMKNYNMITREFSKYFKKIHLPKGNYIDGSRLFVDKERTIKYRLNKYSISSILFLSMAYYTRNYSYDDLCAVISHQMLTIFKRVGGNVCVINKGISEKKEII
ncbi:MAG TPA: acyl-homoserine-lactone synthase [Arsenophonus sp.]